MVAGLYCLGFDLLKVDWLDIALKLKSDVQLILFFMILIFDSDFFCFLQIFNVDFSPLVSLIC